MQKDRIIEKAKRLGIKTTSPNSLEQLEEIALQLGVDDFNPTFDLSILELKLDEEIALEKETVIENDGVSEHVPIEENNAYSNSISTNRSNKYTESKTLKKKETEDNKDKNGFQNRFNRKQNTNDKPNLKTSGRNKTKIKGDSENTLKPKYIFNFGKKNKKKLKNNNLIKKERKPKKGLKEIVRFFKSNPIILAFIGIMLFIIFMIFMYFFFLEGSSSKSTNGSSGYYDKTYNYNESKIIYTSTSGSESTELDFGDYIKGVVYANTKDDNTFTDEAKKAMMIVIKTNLLSSNEYTYNDKNLSADLTYENIPEDKKDEYAKLYNPIENYLYLSEEYDSNIESLGVSNNLEFNIEDFRSTGYMNYESILNDIYKDQNLKLYDFTEYAKFYEYSKYNSAFWWPIGSADVTLGENIYGGNPITTKVSSKYGMRKHPIYDDYRMHNGIDISDGKDNCGEILIAVKSGTVSKVINGCVAGSTDDARSCGGGFGNYIIINHDDGISSLYAHMQNNSAVVKVGDKVEQGQKIGLVGTTGTSTGCHLHFEIRVNGQRVDPLGFVDPNNARSVQSHTIVSR